MRAHRSEENAADVAVVDRKEAVDVIDSIVFAEEILAAADVAEALFAHRAAEPDVALRFNAGSFMQRSASSRQRRPEQLSPMPGAR